MRGLLPSLWLLGAGLYTASLLALLQPFADEDWPQPRPVNETVAAKSPPAVTAQALGDIPPVLAARPATPRVKPRQEWVEVAGYTAMVRSRPSPDAAPLRAYTPGKPLRVIAREGAYARVQDLGSGQLGWIEQASLAPYSGGARRRPPRPAEALVAAAPAAPQAVEAVAEPVPEPLPQLAAHKPKPRGDGIAARLAKQAVAPVEPVERGWFRRKRGIQRVALGERGGMAGMIDRAIRGF
jgi:hypothetical protein